MKQDKLSKVNRWWDKLSKVNRQSRKVCFDHLMSSWAFSSRSSRRQVVVWERSPGRYDTRGLGTRQRCIEGCCYTLVHMQPVYWRTVRLHDNYRQPTCLVAPRMYTSPALKTQKQLKVIRLDYESLSKPSSPTSMYPSYHLHSHQSPHPSYPCEQATRATPPCPPGSLELVRGQFCVDDQTLFSSVLDWNVALTETG